MIGSVKARRSIFAALIVAGLMAMMGCGSESVPKDGTADARLMELLSAAIRLDRETESDAVSYSDFVQARKQLELADDVSAYDIKLSPLGGALNYAAGPDESPLERAIDGSSVVTAASRNIAFGIPALDAVRTEQPFSEIATALQNEGYEKDRDLWVDRGSLPDPGSVVADAGDGVLLLGGSEEFVRKVLSTEDPPASRSTRLIDEVPGVARVAFSNNEAVEESLPKCVVAVAAGQDLSPNNGEMLLVLDEKADADKLKGSDSATPGGSVVLGDAVASGNKLRVDLSSNDPLNAAIYLLPLDGSSYKC